MPGIFYTLESAQDAKAEAGTKEYKKPPVQIAPHKYVAGPYDVHNNGKWVIRVVIPEHLVEENKNPSKVFHINNIHNKQEVASVVREAVLWRNRQIGYNVDASRTQVPPRSEPPPPFEELLQYDNGDVMDFSDEEPLPALSDLPQMPNMESPRRTGNNNAPPEAELPWDDESHGWGNTLRAHPVSNADRTFTLQDQVVFDPNKNKFYFAYKSSAIRRRYYNTHSEAQEGMSAFIEKHGILQPNLRNAFT